MDVAVDGPHQKLILDSRINLEHLRVVLEHLIKIVFRIELSNSFDGQHSAHQELLGRFGISSKIALSLL